LPCLMGLRLGRLIGLRFAGPSGRCIVILYKHRCAGARKVTTMSPMTDQQLFEAVVNERPGAFDAFVERYGRRLLAFGIRMCGDVEDAEDIFQETLLAAYQGLARLREPGAMRTWLYRVASNACRMKRRKEKPSRTISIEEFRPPGWEDGFTPEIPDWSQLPDDAGARAELRGALEEGIAELPPDYRIVLLLRDVEGLSTEEAAEALGLGISAVKMRLHRARLALRARLEEHHVAAGEGGRG